MKLNESATVAINSLAKQKIAAGINIFNLSAGEPELMPHPIIVDAALQALKQGKTLYPPVAGIPELKQAASQWMNHEYQCNFTADQCVVTPGGKFAIYLLLQYLLKPADEVIIPAPYWVSYPSITELFGGKACIVPTRAEQGWKLTPEQLITVCHTRSRILILNNACNPTGALYSREELQALLAVAKQYDLWVISDEVYSGLCFDDKPYVSCGAFAQHRERVIVVQSCSKSFAMTGWRVGFTFAPPTIIQALTILLGQSTSGTATLSQWAATAALQHSTLVNSYVNGELKKRRNALVNAFNTAFNLQIAAPLSSLYLFVSLPTLGVNELSSQRFCERALAEANVATVPGIAFGQEGFVRLSFGADPERLTQAVAALADFCQQAYRGH